jgi:hypothetical protein
LDSWSASSAVPPGSAGRSCREGKGRDFTGDITFGDRD